ncbi:hypothetical protein GJ496_008809, partial [Pomphorhynchus laevis]
IKVESERSHVEDIEHLSSSYNDECPICWENTKYIAMLLPCSHQVCLRCLSHWFKHSKQCPLCRSIVNCVQYPDFTTLNTNSLRTYKIKVCDRKFSNMRELIQPLSRKSQIRKIRRLLYLRNWKLDSESLVRHRSCGPHWYSEHPSDIDMLFYWIHRELRATNSRRLTTSTWKKLCCLLKVHNVNDKIIVDFFRYNLNVSQPKRFVLELKAYAGCLFGLNYFDSNCTYENGYSLNTLAEYPEPLIFCSKHTTDCLL